MHNQADEEDATVKWIFARGETQLPFLIYTNQKKYLESIEGQKKNLVSWKKKTVSRRRWFTLLMASKSTFLYVCKSRRRTDPSVEKKEDTSEEAEQTEEGVSTCFRPASTPTNCHWFASLPDRELGRHLLRLHIVSGSQLCHWLSFTGLFFVASPGLGAFQLFSQSSVWTSPWGVLVKLERKW